MQLFFHLTKDASARDSLLGCIKLSKHLNSYDFAFLLRCSIKPKKPITSAIVDTNIKLKKGHQSILRH